jgi:hypothetical protein
MKNLLILAFLFLSNLAFGQTQATVLAETLKIYASPSTDAPVICTRGKGATVTVLSTDSVTHFSYVQACLDGSNGYAPTFQIAETVFICNGPFAKKYHARENCKGLENCKGGVSKFFIKKALVKYGACHVCYH